MKTLNLVAGTRCVRVLWSVTLVILLTGLTVGCSGPSAVPAPDTAKTYRANMNATLDAVDRTMARLNYRIVRHDEGEGSHFLVGEYAGAPPGRGGRGGGRDPELREMSVTIVEVGPRESRVEVQLPPANSYQAAPSRERVLQFFRILEGLGLQPVG